MSYHHLTTFERGRIQELLSLGYSHRKIAKSLIGIAVFSLTGFPEVVLPKKKL